MKSYLIKSIYIIYSLIFCFFLLLSCSSMKKLNKLKEHTTMAVVSLTNDNGEMAYPNLLANIDTLGSRAVKASTELQGDVLLMNVVEDTKSGEMVISDYLKEIVIEAKFKNIAERNGYVDIAFNIIVPMSMQDSNWQIRFSPTLYYLEDSLKLDKILITGEKYRNEQLRGYELYAKFLKSIISDTCDFIQSFCYERQLNIFIDRNLKKISKLRNSNEIIVSTYAKSIFGINEKRAIEHYTKNWLVNKNNKRKLSKDLMYNKYIKSPITSEGIRLDTVIRSTNGSIIYNYIQTIRVRKNLKKVQMRLDGSIFKQQSRIYIMPRTKALTFYISSMTSLVDNNQRFLTKVIERRASVNTSAFVDFKAGKWLLDDTLSNNEYEIARIKSNIMQIIDNKIFIVDSIILCSSCSPEGAYKFNVELADKRAKSFEQYFSTFIKNKQDSINKSVWNINLVNDGSVNDDSISIGSHSIERLIKTKTIVENWDKLYKLIKIDSNLVNRDALIKCFSIDDLDLREKALSKCQDYLYLRQFIYPYLRTVSFSFYLHRRGMIKDTIHTTVLDTIYNSGVMALKEFDYKTALTLLRPYNDYNTALAYLCLNYNLSAIKVLEQLNSNSYTSYLLAVAKTRVGDEASAIEFLLKSIKQDKSMKFRANLDPEIKALCKKFNLLL